MLIFQFHIGNVLSENPLKYDATWKCENYPDNCNFEPVSSETIERLELAADEEIMKGPRHKSLDGKLGINSI